jgi:hypothetical protein
MLSVPKPTPFDTLKMTDLDADFKEVKGVDFPPLLTHW